LTHHEPSNRNPGALQVHLLRIKEKRNKYDYNQGWTVDLFQGLGCREARRILAWLAAERGRMGRADAVSGAARISSDRARPAGERTLRQTWGGNNLDTYADDLAEVIEALDLKDAMLVGHSTGGGEVTRYVGRHGNKRLSKLVLIGAIPPVMLKSEKNPGGLPLSAFDELRAGMVADRS
jgi:pimeloyl-ACP methyl ester carboxylesterase